MSKYVLWGFLTIGGYLVLKNYIGFERAAGAASNTVVGIGKMFQGR